MAINHIEGPPGAGKTTLLMCFAWARRNYHLFVNYNKFQFVDVDGKPMPGEYHIHKLNGLGEIRHIKESPACILGDEIWQNLSSDDSHYLRKKAAKDLMQARKAGGTRGGEDTDVFSTVQNIGQFQAKIRRVSSIAYLPEIILKAPDKMPLVLRVKWYDMQDWRKNGETTISTLQTDPVSGKVCCIPNSYDTNEVIEEGDSEQSEAILAVIKKYGDYAFEDIKVPALADLIWAKEIRDKNPQTKAFCRSAANLIKSGLIDDLLKKTPV